MENTFWTALVTSLLAALVTSLGIYTIRRFADWGERNTTYFMCFAAGCWSPPPSCTSFPARWR